MEYILICLLLYGILIVADLVPAIKKKDKKSLRVSLPIYSVTFILNILIGLGLKLPSINKAIEGIIKFIFPMK